jgi:hypothetical protein
VQLFQAFGADRLDAQWDFLQVFRALLRRDDDALQNAFTVGFGRPDGLQTRGDRRGQRHAGDLQVSTLRVPLELALSASSHRDLPTVSLCNEVYA